MTKRGVFVVAAGLAFAVPALGATLEGRCKGGKTESAGKLAACLGKAEKGLSATGDADSYTADVAACVERFQRKWQRLDELAAVGPVDCPGDGGEIQNFVEACGAAVASAIDGGTLPPDPISCNAGLTSCALDLSLCESELSSCQVRTLRTGQTTCFDGTGTPINCAGSGQDGELQVGYVRGFIDNGDGTITDTATNLVWEKLSDDGSIHDKDTYFQWAAAFQKIDALNTMNFAGASDWRLPNQNELLSLLYYGNTFGTPAIWPAFHTGCAPGCSVDGIGGPVCSCVSETLAYWSSTTPIRSPAERWMVSFNPDGPAVGYTPVPLAWGVRAVRGGN